VTAEEFTNRFLTGLQSKQSGALRRAFLEAQAWLVDDFHFLAGKLSTLVEFLHTCETLQKQGKPVAVACDAHPKIVPALLPELADRLLGGGVWPLTLPDRDTRAGIIMARSTRLNCPLPEDGVWYLADELHGNVRELEGALNTIHHYRQVHGAPMTLDLIREALGDLLKHTSRALQLSDVEQALANVLGLPKKAFHSKDKCRSASYPRMLAIHLARKKTSLPYREIGRYFGGRSHGTAIAAERKVQQWLADDTPLILGNRRWLIRELIEAVEREMGQG
jgi:chromosomal replication initiator protein